MDKYSKLLKDSHRLVITETLKVKMSEQIQEKKQERSKAKTAVTLASRRLTNAANRDVEFEILKGLMTDLEKVYDEFWCVSEEFEELVLHEEYAEHRTVNGEDLIEYRRNVQRSYDEARDVFVQQKARNEEISKSQAAGPARIALRFDLRRMGELLKAVDENFKNLNPNVEALKLDKQELQSMLDMMCKKTSELYLIESSQSEQDLQLQSEIDKAVGQVYSQVRTINLYLQKHERSLSSLSKEQVSSEGTSSGSYEDNSPSEDVPSSGPQHLSDTQPGPQETPTLVNNSDSETVSSNLPSTVVVASSLDATTPSFQSPTSLSSENQIPMINASQTSDVSINNTTTDLSSQQHLGATPFVSVGATQVNPATLLQYPTHTMPLSYPLQPVNPNPILHIQNVSHHNPSSPYYQLDTGTTPHYMYDAAPTISCAITSQQSLSNSQSYPQPHMGTNTYLSSSMSPGTITSSPHSATMPSLFPSTLNNSPFTPNTQHPPTIYPGPSVSGAPIAQPAPVPVSSLNPQLTSHFVPYRMSVDPNVQIKKMSLPTFSGQRKDWPEFKAVWKSVAEAVYTNKTALAHELKRSVKGEASKRIRSVYVTKPEAYEVMWKKLENHYEDVGASVQAALEDLHRLKAVAEEDYKGLVELIDETELAYSQLEELGKLNILTMRDVDMISDLLPSNLKVEWMRKYRDMDPSEKINPFIAFMEFLDGEREAVARIAEAQARQKNNEQRRNERRRRHGYHADKRSSSKYHKCAFPSHRKDAINHTTVECKEFQKLPIGGKNGKYELLKQIDACFKCFGNHRRKDCPKKESCVCGSKEHHQLLCERKDPKQTPEEEKKDEAATRKETHVSQGNSPSLYPIYQATVCGSNKSISVFCDGGSNATYITHRAAERIRAKKLGKITLDVTTMGNVEKTHHTQQYEFTLCTKSGRKVTVTAYGMDQITGPVNKLDYKVLEKMFPEYDPESLQKKCNRVDVLLGCDFFGLHPKKEEARYGEHLSVMSGELGICLQGTHPELTEGTQYDCQSYP